MRRRSDGGKLIYLMTGQKDARAVQVKDFVEFMQIIDQRCLESQLKTLYGLLEDKRKRAVTRDGIHKLLRNNHGYILSFLLYFEGVNGEIGLVNCKSG